MANYFEGYKNALSVDMYILRGMQIFTSTYVYVYVYIYVSSYNILIW